MKSIEHKRSREVEAWIRNELAEQKKRGTGSPQP